MKKINKSEIMKVLKSLLKRSLVNSPREFKLLMTIVQNIRELGFWYCETVPNATYDSWEEARSVVSFEELMLWWGWVAGSSYGYFWGDDFPHMYRFDNMLFLKLVDEFRGVDERIYFRPEKKLKDAKIKIYKDKVIIEDIKIKLNTEEYFVTDVEYTLDSIFCCCKKEGEKYVLSFRNGKVIEVKFDEGKFHCSRHRGVSERELCRDVIICCLKNPDLLATAITCKPEYARYFKNFVLEGKNEGRRIKKIRL